MKKIIFGIFIISAVVASFALYAGITHNSMGEFCVSDELQDKRLCDFDYYYAFFIWITWFIPLFIIQIIIVVVIKYFMSFLTNSSSGR